MWRVIGLCASCYFIIAVGVRAQQSTPAEPVAPPTPQDEDDVLTGDWAPELLDAILSSPNQGAHDALMDATFAAGPSILPQLGAREPLVLVGHGRWIGGRPHE